ncbi:toxin glutamine deamidase domain-containing protein [Micromonospora sp. NPDC005367]|uniref:toxin glutamine deamidase domain-containing protein n=1 Tax=Micromonospora sp. NPDC005367 TaxID=3155590 RepID=UPI0033A1AD47
MTGATGTSNGPANGTTDDTTADTGTTGGTSNNSGAPAGVNGADNDATSLAPATGVNDNSNADNGLNTDDDFNIENGLNAAPTNGTDTTVDTPRGGHTTDSGGARGNTPTAAVDGTTTAATGNTSPTGPQSPQTAIINPTAVATTNPAGPTPTSLPGGLPGFDSVTPSHGDGAAGSDSPGRYSPSISPEPSTVSAPVQTPTSPATNPTNPSSITQPAATSPTPAGTGTANSLDSSSATTQLSSTVSTLGVSTPPAPVTADQFTGDRFVADSLVVDPGPLDQTTSIAEPSPEQPAEPTPLPYAAAADSNSSDTTTPPGATSTTPSTGTATGRSVRPHAGTRATDDRSSTAEVVTADDVALDDGVRPPSGLPAPVQSATQNLTVEIPGPAQLTDRNLSTDVPASVPPTSVTAVAPAVGTPADSAPESAVGDNVSGLRWWGSDLPGERDRRAALTDTYPWLEQVSEQPPTSDDELSNCFYTAIAFHQSWDSDQVWQAPADTGPASFQSIRNYANSTADPHEQGIEPREFVQVTGDYQTIADIFTQAPDNAHGFLVIGPEPGQPTHVINVVKTSNGPVFIDSQTGQAAELPPHPHDLLFIPVGTTPVTIPGTATTAETLDNSRKPPTGKRGPAKPGDLEGLRKAIDKAGANGLNRTQIRDRFTYLDADAIGGLLVDLANTYPGTYQAWEQPNGRTRHRRRTDPSTGVDYPHPPEGSNLRPLGQAGSSAAANLEQPRRATSSEKLLTRLRKAIDKAGAQGLNRSQIHSGVKLPAGSLDGLLGDLANTYPGAYQAWEQHTARSPDLRFVRRVADPSSGLDYPPPVGASNLRPLGQDGSPANLERLREAIDNAGAQGLNRTQIYMQVFHNHLSKDVLDDLLNQLADTYPHTYQAWKKQSGLTHLSVVGRIADPNTGLDYPPPAGGIDIHTLGQDSDLEKLRRAIDNAGAPGLSRTQIYVQVFSDRLRVDTVDGLLNQLAGTYPHTYRTWVQRSHFVGRIAAPDGSGDYELPSGAHKVAPLEEHPSMRAIQAQTTLAQHGRVLNQAPFDGDCFFHAFASTMLAELARDPSHTPDMLRQWREQLDVQALRTRLANLARPRTIDRPENPPVPHLVLDAAISEETAAYARELDVPPAMLLAQWSMSGQADQALGRIRAQIRTRGSWDNAGGELVPYLAAAAFNVRILVVYPGEGRTQMIGGGNGPVITLYRPDRSHWDGTVPTGHDGNIQMFPVDTSDAMVAGLDQAIKDLEEKVQNDGGDPAVDKTIRFLREKQANWARPVGSLDQPAGVEQSAPPYGDWRGDHVGGDVSGLRWWGSDLPGERDRRAALTDTYPWLEQVSEQPPTSDDELSNCFYTAIAFHQSWDSDQVWQAPADTGPASFQSIRNYANSTADPHEQGIEPREFVQVTGDYQTIADIFTQAPDNAHGFLVIGPEPGQPTHVINVVKTSNGPVFIDSQTGQAAELPPHPHDLLFIPVGTTPVTIPGTATTAETLDNSRKPPTGKHRSVKPDDLQRLKDAIDNAGEKGLARGDIYHVFSGHLRQNDIDGLLEQVVNEQPNTYQTWKQRTGPRSYLHFVGRRVDPSIRASDQRLTERINVHPLGEDPAGASKLDRLRGAIDNAGARGLTRTDIDGLFKKALNATSIDGLLNELANAHPNTYQTWRQRVSNGNYVQFMGRNVDRTAGESDQALGRRVDVRPLGQSGSQAAVDLDRRQTDLYRLREAIDNAGAKGLNRTEILIDVFHKRLLKEDIDGLLGRLAAENSGVYRTWSQGNGRFVGRVAAPGSRLTYVLPPGAFNVEPLGPRTDAGSSGLHALVDDAAEQQGLAVAGASSQPVVSDPPAEVTAVMTLASHGRVWMPVPPDGDCFFRAFVGTIFAERVRDPQFPREELRIFEGMRVQELRDMLADLVRPGVVDRSENPPVPPAVLEMAIRDVTDVQAHGRGMSVEDVLRRIRDQIRTPRSWDNAGGDLVPYLAAAAFNVRIRIIFPGASQGQVQEIGGGNGPVITLYRSDRSHWDSTAPPGPARDMRTFPADTSDAMVAGLDQTINDLEERIRNTGGDPAADETLRRLREQRATWARPVGSLNQPVGIEQPTWAGEDSRGTPSPQSVPGVWADGLYPPAGGAGRGGPRTGGGSRGSGGQPARDAWVSPRAVTAWRAAAELVSQDPTDGTSADRLAEWVATVEVRTHESPTPLVDCLPRALGAFTALHGRLGNGHSLDDSFLTTPTVADLETLLDARLSPARDISIDDLWQAVRGTPGMMVLVHARPSNMVGHVYWLFADDRSNPVIPRWIDTQRSGLFSDKAQDHDPHATALTDPRTQLLVLDETGRPSTVTELLERFARAGDQPPGLPPGTGSARPAEVVTTVDALLDPNSGGNPSSYGERPGASGSRGGAPNSYESVLGHLRAAVRPDASATEGGTLGPDLFGTHRAPALPNRFPFIDANRLRTTQIPDLFEMFDLTSSRTPRFDLSAADLRDDDSRVFSATGSDMPLVFHAIWLGGALPQRYHDNLAAWAAGVGAANAMFVLWTDTPRSQFRAAPPGTELAGMLEWARGAGAVLLNVDELFSDRSPMSLDEQYRTEMNKLVNSGFGAASDILRLEILYRYGGIYTDVDNEFRSLVGLRELFDGEGFAVHTRGVANSAFLAARRHSFIEAALSTIQRNYGITQPALYQNQRWPYEHSEQDTNRVVRTRYGALRRHSIVLRTGPLSLLETVQRHGYREGAQPGYFPGLPNLERQLTVGSAGSWRRTERPLSANRTWSTGSEGWVAIRVVSTLLRHLRNRPGDLYLTAVAPVIDGTPNPRAVWDAVLTFIMQLPGVAGSITTITHRMAYGDDSNELVDSVPDYVLARFGVTQSNPQRWILGELQSWLTRPPGSSAGQSQPPAGWGSSSSASSVNSARRHAPPVFGQPVQQPPTPTTAYPGTQPMQYSTGAQNPPQGAPYHPNPTMQSTQYGPPVFGQQQQPSYSYPQEQQPRPLGRGQSRSSRQDRRSSTHPYGGPGRASGAGLDWSPLVTSSRFPDDAAVLEVFPWLAEVNADGSLGAGSKGVLETDVPPGTDPASLPPGVLDGSPSTNCVWVAIGVDQSLNDPDSVWQVPAMPPTPETYLVEYQRGELNLPDSESRVYRTDLDSVHTVMEDAPPGARGVVLVRARTVTPSAGLETSHAFNVVRLDNGVVFLDGQRPGLAHIPTDTAEYLFLPTTNSINEPAHATRIDPTDKRGPAKPSDLEGLSGAVAGNPPGRGDSTESGPVAAVNSPATSRGVPQGWTDDGDLAPPSSPTSPTAGQVVQDPARRSSAAGDWVNSARRAARRLGSQVSLPDGVSKRLPRIAKTVDTRVRLNRRGGQRAAGIPVDVRPGTRPSAIAIKIDVDEHRVLDYATSVKRDPQESSSGLESRPRFKRRLWLRVARSYPHAEHSLVRATAEDADVRPPARPPAGWSRRIVRKTRSAPMPVAAASDSFATRPAEVAETPPDSGRTVSPGRETGQNRADRAGDAGRPELDPPVGVRVAGPVPAMGSASTSSREPAPSLGQTEKLLRRLSRMPSAATSRIRYTARVLERLIANVRLPDRIIAMMSRATNRADVNAEADGQQSQQRTVEVRTRIDVRQGKASMAATNAASAGSGTRHRSSRARLALYINRIYQNAPDRPGRRTSPNDGAQGMVRGRPSGTPATRSRTVSGTSRRSRLTAARTTAPVRRTWTSTLRMLTQPRPPLPSSNVNTRVGAVPSVAAVPTTNGINEPARATRVGPTDMKDTPVSGPGEHHTTERSNPAADSRASSRPTPANTGPGSEPRLKIVLGVRNVALVGAGLEPDSVLMSGPDELVTVVAGARTALWQGPNGRRFHESVESARQAGEPHPQEVVVNTPEIIARPDRARPVGVDGPSNESLITQVTDVLARLFAAPTTNRDRSTIGALFADSGFEVNDEFAGSNAYYLDNLHQDQPLWLQGTKGVSLAEAQAFLSDAATTDMKLSWPEPDWDTLITSPRFPDDDAVLQVFPWLPEVNADRSLEIDSNGLVKANLPPGVEPDNVPAEALYGSTRTNCVWVAIGVDQTLKDPRMVWQVPAMLSTPEAYVVEYQRGELNLSNTESFVYRTDIDSIRSAMKAAPPGSRGIVLVRARTTTPTGLETSHAFNVVHHENGVVFLDGQRAGLAPAPDEAAEYLFLPVTDRIDKPENATLVDPTELAGRLAARAGTEHELHSGYLALPAGVDRRTVKYVARNDSNGITAVLDLTYVSVLRSGTEYQTESGIDAAEVRDDSVLQPIIEFVDQPFRVWNGEQGLSSNEVGTFRKRTIERFNAASARMLENGWRPGLQVPLEQLLPATEGWHINPDLAGTRFVPLMPGGIPDLSAHFSVGIRLAAVGYFLTELWDHHSWHKDSQYPVNEIKDDATSFANEIAEWFGAAVSNARPDEALLLENFMLLTYMQVAGSALSHTRDSRGKFFTAATLRNSFRKVRGLLELRPRHYLNHNARHIRNRFAEIFLARFPDYDRQFRDYNDEPVGGPPFGPLNIVGEFLDDALLDSLRNPIDNSVRAPVTLFEAMRVHSELPLDTRPDGEQMIVLELRYLFKPLLTASESAAGYATLEEALRRAEERADRVLGADFPIGAMDSATRSIDGLAGWHPAGDRVAVFDQRYGWIRDVNDGGPDAHATREAPDPGWLVNCLLTAISTHLTISEGQGDMFHAPPLDPRVTLGTRDAANYANSSRGDVGPGVVPRRLVRVESYAQVTEALAKAPLGAHGFLTVRLADRPDGHVFNAFHEADGVVIVDSQTGQTWLPENPEQILFIPVGPIDVPLGGPPAGAVGATPTSVAHATDTNAARPVLTEDDRPLSRDPVLHGRATERDIVVGVRNVAILGADLQPGSVLMRSPDRMITVVAGTRASLWRGRNNRLFYETAESAHQDGEPDPEEAPVNIPEIIATRGPTRPGPPDEHKDDTLVNDVFDILSRLWTASTANRPDTTVGALFAGTAYEVNDDLTNSYAYYLNNLHREQPVYLQQQSRVVSLAQVQAFLSDPPTNHPDTQPTSDPTRADSSGTQAGNELPLTGGLVDDPHSRSQTDHRGALSGTDLLALVDNSGETVAGPPPPAVVAHRPPEVPQTGPVVQKAALQAIVDQVAGMDAPAQIRCEVQVQELRSLLHPAVRPSRSLEEADAGGTTVTARLLPSWAWQDQVTWSEAGDTMRAAPPGSTMLFVVQRANGPGHALALHRTESDVWWLEPGSEEPANRVRSAMPEFPSLYARAVLIDPDGSVREIPQAARGKLAAALTDPPTGRVFGALGFEAETPFATTVPENLLRREHLKEIAASKNLAIHLDVRNQVIIELVSPPFNILDGEREYRDRDAVLRSFENELTRLAENSRTPRLDTFYSYERGFSITEDMVAGYNLKPFEALSRDADPLRDLYMQYTVGVPLTAMDQFLEFVAQHTYEPDRVPLVRAARAFARRLSRRFQLKEGAQHEFDAIRDAMEIRGFMSMAYTHVVALALDEVAQVLQQSARLRKNHLLAASRFSLAAMRNLLSNRAQGWLSQNADRIANELVTHAENAIDGLLALGATANVGSFLDIRVELMGDRTTITPRNLLYNALMPLSLSDAEYTQDRVFGISSHVPSWEVSRDNDRLARVELRSFGRDTRVSIGDVRHDVELIEGFVSRTVRMTDALTSPIDTPSMSFKFGRGQRNLDEPGQRQAESVAQWIVQKYIYRQHVANSAFPKVIVEGGGNNSGTTASEMRAAAVRDELAAATKSWLRAGGLPDDSLEITLRDRRDGVSASPHADQRELAAKNNRWALVWLQPDR